MSSNVTRRGFVAGTIGGSILMGLGPIGCSSDQAGQSTPTLNDKDFAPTVWFEINPQGDVHINIKRAEMGQHVGTALSRIVADELGANWDKVSFTHVDSHPKWGFMVTGGSWSVSTSFFELSRAGAAGRIVLIEAGAALLGKPAGECRAENGEVICGSQRISFGEIVSRGKVERSFSDEELAALPVKTPDQYQLMGKDTQARDIPAKTDGTAVYGLDVELPGMVYARPVIPPTRYGCSVKSVDESAAKQVAGYRGYVELKDPSALLQGWLAVSADTFPAAIKAADALKVEYVLGPQAATTEADILAEGERIVADPEASMLFIDDGDMDEARSGADRQLSAIYRTSSNLHFALEPMNALAEFRDGHCHVHTGNQWQSLTLPALAAALEMPESDITLHQYYLGGGFGRRLLGDYTVPAALAAKAMGVPVKMVWTRDDDSRFDNIRSPSVQAFNATLSGDGLTGIEHSATAGWPTKQMAPGFLFDSLDGKGKIDPFSSSGANHWYTLENHRVRMASNELAEATFLPGWLRAVGAGWLGWGVEGFMDEIAEALGEDPLDLRIRLLDGAGKQAGEAPISVGGATRLAEVLKTLKQRSGWGRVLPADEGLGIAACAGQERTMPTWVGCVAHVKVDRSTGKVRVKKLTAQTDCGLVVHPDGALAQMESSMLWGMSLALHEGTEIEAGQVKDRNLDSYTPLRMADLPELDIEFTDSTEMPVGLGEPGLIVIAPAIANAIYDAVGVRLRNLPMRPADVLAGLA